MWRLGCRRPLPPACLPACLPASTCCGAHWQCVHVAYSIDSLQQPSARWHGATHATPARVQDCVFLKEPGYSATNWHSDLRMAPFDTNAFVTAWIPLRSIAGDEAEGDSGACCSAGACCT